MKPCPVVHEANFGGGLSTGITNRWGVAASRPSHVEAARRRRTPRLPRYCHQPAAYLPEKWQDDWCADFALHLRGIDDNGGMQMWDCGSWKLGTEGHKRQFVPSLIRSRLSGTSFINDRREYSSIPSVLPQVYRRNLWVRILLSPSYSFSFFFFLYSFSSFSFFNFFIF
jgi:hypothetical protein